MNSPATTTKNLPVAHWLGVSFQPARALSWKWAGVPSPRHPRKSNLPKKNRIAPVPPRSVSRLRALGIAAPFEVALREQLHHGDRVYRLDARLSGHDLAHHDVAGQEQSDPGLETERPVGQLRVAGA